MMMSNDWGVDLDCPCAIAVSDKVRIKPEIRSRCTFILILFSPGKPPWFSVNPPCLCGGLFLRLFHHRDSEGSQRFTGKRHYGLVVAGFSTLLYFFIKSIALSANLNRCGCARFPLVRIANPSFRSRLPRRKAVYPGTLPLCAM